MTDQPRPILLEGLNRGLHDRSRGGFTDPDGNLTLANAGHISPCRNGVEMAVESLLPCGILDDATCFQSSFQLDENEQRILVIDDVVEACDKNGELFDFARTYPISTSLPKT